MRRLLLLGVLVATPVQAAPRGWAVYDRFCLACHGALGDGKGPAAPFTWGRPRAFVRGDYEWRSTPTGKPPSDDDLRATIRYGARGSSMPAFGDTLTPAQIDDVIAVVKAFDPPAFKTTSAPGKLGPTPPKHTARGVELWTQLGCHTCHGEHGRGDGPAAATLAEPPYDLTTDPLRRPRATDDVEARRRAAATSIATGMAGSPMPGYGGQVAEADLWALADYVVLLGTRAARTDRSALDDDEIAEDRKTPITTGVWPGNDPSDARVFGALVAPQGAPPPSLAPAEASLSARQCGRCHAKQVREWQNSLHAGAGSPGLFAQLDSGIQDTTCRRCHTPLAEQQPGDVYDPALRSEGVTCASCHVRAWTRHGPPDVSPTLLATPGYPLVELPIYERADMCLACHQLPPRTAVVGKPLLNTYKEWLEGPYMRRGIQCQHCHMPNREHQWLGVHDRDTFRQGIRLDATAHRAPSGEHAGGVTVVAELANVGAGHYLPTTPTPAAWLRIELVDARGVLIDGARGELRIGRAIHYDGSTWHETSDTRIPPGETRTLARAWSGGRTAEATAARVTVEVHPDDYYEGFYVARLREQITPAVRAQYEQALARARSTYYIAEQRDVALSSSR